MSADAGYHLSGFADEISPNLDEQTDTLRTLGIAGLDLRSVGGVNVLDLSDADLDRVKEACSARGLHVQAVGSPVNKVKYSPDARQNEDRKLARAIEIAHYLGVEKIRVFSPEQGDATDAEIMDWMRRHVRMATEAGVVLLHENDGVFWGAYPEHSKLLLKELGGPSLRAAFDFANAVLIGLRPMRDWFPWILPYLDTLHVKDAVEATRSIVPAGRGDGEMLETFRLLAREGWQGTLTLEPHLSAAGAFGGFSGGQLFGEATRALRHLLDEASR
jgi:sugar phosphate isomerase/epimerase